MADRPDIPAIAARVAAATEEWGWVPGFEGRYEVSTNGRLRSYVGRKRGTLSELPRMLTVSPKPGRYARVHLLADDGTYHRRAVHRLVLETFVGPAPQPRDEGCHLNGATWDNRLNNLAWASHRVNESHKIEHGTVPEGEVNGRSRFTAQQVYLMRMLRAEGLGEATIAPLFGTTRATVWDIVTRKNWAHLPDRTDVPALIAYVEALEAERDRLREALTKVEDVLHDICPYFTGDAERRSEAFAIIDAALTGGGE